MKILIAEPRDFSPQALTILRGLGDVRCDDVSAGSLAAAVGDAQVLWLRLGHRVDQPVLERASDLGFVVCPATGTDHIDVAACQARGISVLSLKGETEFLRTLRGTAELTVGLAIALCRNLPSAAEHAASGEVWKRDLFKGTELHGKKVGIVGLGRLGTVVASLLNAFGCEVGAVDADRTREAPAGVQIFPDLRELIAGADLVSLHVDLNPSSQGMVDAAFLSSMKKGARLVNTSRGQVIHTRALLDALASGRLGGAALDVLEGEHEPGQRAAFDAARDYARHRELVLPPHRLR